jgi:hypothetical protein
MFGQNWNPIELFNNGDISAMLEGQYWNYNKYKSYKAGQITVGLVKIKPKEDFWLLFHIGQVTKDLNILNGVGYEYQFLPELLHREQSQKSHFSLRTTDSRDKY